MTDDGRRHNGLVSGNTALLLVLTGLRDRYHGTLVAEWEGSGNTSMVLVMRIARDRFLGTLIGASDARRRMREMSVAVNTYNLCRC